MIMQDADLPFQSKIFLHRNKNDLRVKNFIWKSFIKDRKKGT